MFAQASVTWRHSSDPTMDDDPDDEVWDGPPVGGAPTPSPTPVVQVSISKRKDCPLPPYCEWYAPSETRKRPKGKVLQLVPFDLSVRPDPTDGRWRCKTCPSSYDTRTLLFGHTRFCEGVLLPTTCIMSCR